MSDWTEPFPASEIFPTLCIGMWILYCWATWEPPIVTTMLKTSDRPAVRVVTIASEWVFIGRFT